MAAANLPAAEEKQTIKAGFIFPFAVDRSLHVIVRLKPDAPVSADLSEITVASRIVHTGKLVDVFADNIESRLDKSQLKYGDLGTEGTIDLNFVHCPAFHTLN